jgi:hypothetical protein
LPETKALHMQCFKYQWRSRRFAPPPFQSWDSKLALNLNIQKRNSHKLQNSSGSTRPSRPISKPNKSTSGIGLSYLVHTTRIFTAHCSLWTNYSRLTDKSPALAIFSHRFRPPGSAAARASVLFFSSVVREERP